MSAFDFAMLRRIVSVPLLMTFAFASAQAQELPSAKLILDWAIQGHNSAITMGEEKGWYKEAGANVTVSRGYGSGDTVAKIATGAFQIGYGDIYVLLRFLGSNPAQRMKCFYMAHERSALSVAVHSDSPVTNPRQLIGKRVASPVGDASRQVFPLFAAKNNMKESDITWVNVTADLRETLFVQRQVDAISGSMNTIIMNMAAAKVPQEKIRFFPYADYGLPLYGHCLFATEEFAENNPKVPDGCRARRRPRHARHAVRPKDGGGSGHEARSAARSCDRGSAHRCERRDQFGDAQCRKEWLWLRRQEAAVGNHRRRIEDL